MSTPKIPATAYVLTCNNASTLPACLASLRDFQDILIVDGNSTDATHTIAKDFGARIIPQTDDAIPNQRIENFAAMRQKAFIAARFDWIFQLDSDETVSREVIDTVATMVVANDPKVVVRFQRLAQVEGRIIQHAYFYPEYCLRLVHRGSGAKWNMKRLVHERLLLPSTVRIETGRGYIIQRWLNHRETWRKDTRYLDLALAPAVGSIERVKLLRAAAVNVAKGTYVFFRILGIEFRRLPDRMPFAYHVRFVIYHFRFAMRLAGRAFHL